MSSAVAIQEAFDVFEPAPNRGQVIARYRQLRAISREHNHAAMGLVGRALMLKQARRLGIGLHGSTLLLDDINEMAYVYDMAIHTAPPDRTRVIDRYARVSRPAPGSDEARVLEALREARFSILQVKGRHEAAGLIVTDLFRGEDVWLMDEGLEASAPDHFILATRMFAPDGFYMTAGVFVPVDVETIDAALYETPQLLRKPQAAAIQDRRLAEALYREALADGVLDRVRYVDPGEIPAPRLSAGR